MTLTKKQLEIFRIFYKNPFKELTFKEIKEQSNQKSNNLIQLAIKSFKKQNLLILNKIGDITIYKLNLENNLTFAYLNLINEQRIIQSKIPRTTIMEIEKKINKKIINYVLGIFGSYAKEKATKKSDLDIFILIENDIQKEDIIPLIETIKRREIIEIDNHIITINEFKEMIKADFENLGKQIQKNNLIWCGFTQYMKLIHREKNG